MSEWKKVKLGEITIIKTGKLDSNAAVPNGAYPFFTCDPTTLSIDKWAYDTEAILLAGNNASGNYTAKYYKGKFNAYQRTYIIETLNPQFASVRYMAYAMNQQLQLLKVMSSGSTTKFLTMKMLTQLSIDLPSIETQNRIASILSRYDSLIENYQKQIKLLEEAAQRLYKEWFVNLHFPGYENTKIVDGVPEGWEPSKLGQLAEFKRGKTITKKDIVDGPIPVVAGGLEPAYYCNKSNTAERVITVSGSGANAGFTRMYFEKIWASDCSYVDLETTPYLHFVYCYLKDNKTTIDNMQKGAAQPHVYAKDINALELCIPIEVVLKTFENNVSSYYNKISSLQSQIRLLTEARDRLLPKLMSGEIEV